MWLDLSSPHDACQRRKIKRNREKKLWLLHKSKYIKVKDRPFTEGSRGCHALICLYSQPLSAKESHVVLLFALFGLGPNIRTCLHKHARSQKKKTLSLRDELHTLSLFPFPISLSLAQMLVRCNRGHCYLSHPLTYFRPFSSPRPCLLSKSPEPHCPPSCL